MTTPKPPDDPDDVPMLPADAAPFVGHDHGLFDECTKRVEM